MKLGQALALLAQSRALPIGDSAFVACGFEPLHLLPLLEAHYLGRFPDKRLQLATGVYGDLEGNARRALDQAQTLVFLIVEYSDLDPRLGLRAAAPWSGSHEADVMDGVKRKLQRLYDLLEQLTKRALVVASLPTLPLTHHGHTPAAQASHFQLGLEREIADFALACSRSKHVRILDSTELARRSPPLERLDVRSEFATGFPYRTPHTSALASQLIALGFAQAPKKGLITDLDDTLWSGIVGEVGADAIAWSQAEHAQIHGLYQLFLQQLSDAGVLLGAVSKNTPSVVQAALTRELWLQSERLYPTIASWGPKSDAVARILETWNVNADAVVFVDDSALELAEVQQAHPGLTTLSFNGNEPEKVLALLERLRDLFGKPVIERDDALRAGSLRRVSDFELERSAQPQLEFLRSLNGELTVETSKDPDNTRLLSLLNKTNQFNLDGARRSESEWRAFVAEPCSFVLGFSYTDKFGPLGTIGLMAGRVAEDGTYEVVHWVLSCRAFSRRIEHHMTECLLQRANNGRVSFTPVANERNAPFFDFLRSLGVDDPGGTVVLCRGEHSPKLAPLPHRTSSK